MESANQGATSFNDLLSGMNFDGFDMPQEYAKPNEGETSSFFFGDEGVDTSFGQQTSFDSTMFATSMDNSTAFGMQQPLLDNTSGSTSWGDVNTTFPPPVQSFDSTLYTPQYSGNALGKRPLQLDVQDFPQPKRLETFSPYASSASITGSSWTVDTQPTPSSSTEMVVGLSDEAADVCATWFSKYNVLPSDRHIESLSQLTGESASAIRHWFGQALKQGMNGHDSAYKSQTSGFTQQDAPTIPPVPRFSEMSECLQRTTSAEQMPCDTHTTTTQLRTSKKGRCHPTDDHELLKRDSNKIYQCTRKCGKRYGRKCDWKRNEEEGYPSKSWMCSLCTSQGVERVKPCFRKYHFSQHFRNIHPGLNAADFEDSSLVQSDTAFPRKCGFCPHRFSTRQERIDHIADHFKQGKCMLDWNDDEDESRDSDNMDDDDDSDDRPDSGNGGSGHDTSFYPPGQGPPGGSGPKNNGSGGGSGGGSSSGEQSSEGGFFNFQLSQFSSQNNPEQCPDTNEQSQPTSIDPTEIDRRLANTDSGKQCSTHGGRDPAEKDDTISVAGNAVPIMAVTSAPQSSTEIDAFWKILSSKGTGTTDATRGIAEVTYASAADINMFSHEFFSNTPRELKSCIVIGSSSDHVTKGFFEASGLNVMNVPAAQTYKALKSLGQTMLRLRSVEDVESKTDSKETQRKTTTVSVYDYLAHPPLTSPPPPPPIPIPIPDLRNEALKQYWKGITALLDSQSFLSVKLLGTGGFSTVDEVVHRETRLRISRKTLKNREHSAIEELKKEVNVLQKLRHPHIIRFLGAYSKGDKMSILLSPVAETTLALWLDNAMLTKQEGLAQTIVKMYGCLASSLRYLHEQRPIVKHMDIKPQNILVMHGDQEFPHVILSDFGISSDEDATSNERSKPLTRQYCAPEVSEGISREQAADIWSLGCVYAEMACAAFRCDNPYWLEFRKEYSGRSGKYYWQDTIGLQKWMTEFLDQASTLAEATVAHTLSLMLSEDPAERPSAAVLTMIFAPAPCCIGWPNDQVSYPGPVEELRSVETLVHEDGVDCRSRFHINDGTADQGECDAFTRVRSWYDGCVHDHEACRQLPTEGNSLPTRLVDIQPNGPGSSFVRVVDCSSLDIKETIKGNINYVALSYVWHQDDPKLSTAVLQEMESGLPREALPKSMANAISAADRIGYRYIWVDSLCILQDSEDDVRRECLAMASVYRNAELTMVLLDQLCGAEVNCPMNIGDSSIGCSGNALSSTSDTKTKAAAHQHANESASLPAIDFLTPGFAWDTRAWALQERLLSRRLLILSHGQMYWECNALKASETFPRGLPPLLWEKVHTKPSLDKERPPVIKREYDGAEGDKPISVDNVKSKIDLKKYCCYCGVKNNPKDSWVCGNCGTSCNAFDKHCSDDSMMSRHHLWFCHDCGSSGPPDKTITLESAMKQGKFETRSDGSVTEHRTLPENSANMGANSHAEVSG